MKPVIIGMNNPLSLAPQHALYPHPSRSTGHQLWRMLNMLRPEVTKRDYIRAFERHNLCQGPWRLATARQVASDMLPELQGRTVLLLGERVRQAFRLPPQLVHPIRWHGVEFRQVPHPSGRNLWYNHPTHLLIVGALLEDMYDRFERAEHRAIPVAGPMPATVR